MRSGLNRPGPEILNAAGGHFALSRQGGPAGDLRFRAASGVFPKEPEHGSKLAGNAGGIPFC
jgi:hypothetical protein